MTKCRHSATWLLAGGSVQWCSKCGAYRNLRYTAPTKTFQSQGPWVIPGKDPWTEFKKQREKFAGKETPKEWKAKMVKDEQTR